MNVGDCYQESQFIKISQNSFFIPEKCCKKITVMLSLKYKKGVNVNNEKIF